MHRLFVVALAIVSNDALSQPPQPPPGITRAEVFDNATALVARLRMEPGSREPVHTHPFSAVVVQLTPGEIDMTIGAEHARQAHEPGFVWFIPKEAPHAAVNTSARPVEFVTIAIKSDRPPAPAAPTASPPGITRRPILDNNDARVVQVTFSPGSREPVHTHPYDLITVQITAGRLEIVESDGRSDEHRPPGFVKFIPRGVSHSYGDTDARPVEVLSVAIK